MILHELTDKLFHLCRQHPPNPGVDGLKMVRSARQPWVGERFGLQYPWLGACSHQLPHQVSFPPLLRLFLGGVIFLLGTLSPTGLGLASPPSIDNTSFLASRLQQFPHWSSPPPTQAARGDLSYPEWFSGLWNVQTTLVEKVAPLAPEILTPGFDSTSLDQPVTFQARFVPEQSMPPGRPFGTRSVGIVADRAFNSLNLVKATLKNTITGEKAPILTIKVDPTNPNRQVLRIGPDRQLVSTITERLAETLSPNRFLSSEVSRQEFRGTPQIYFNIVENTTAYTRRADETGFTADQVTAVYLSPQDPNYFKAGDRPVALYRYQMEFRRPNL
jgi:hypothetical protein